MNFSFLQHVEIQRVAHDDRQLVVVLASGRMAFSRATDSGTSSTIDGE